MNGFSLRPLSIGEVLDRAFQIYRGRFPRLILVAAVCSAPTAIVIEVLREGVPPGTTQFSASATSGLVAIAFVWILGTAITWTALAKVCNGTVVGEDVRIGRAVVTGLRLLPRIVLLGILAWLLCMVAVIPAFIGAAIPGLVFSKAGGSLSVVGDIIMAVGFVAGMVLSIVWLTPIFLMSLPAVVGENVGAIGALNRANELGKGARMRTTALALVAGLIMLLPVMAFYALVGMGAAFTGHGIGPGTPQMYVLQVVGWGIGALTAPFYVAVMVMTYYERRVRREGYDVEMASEALTDGASVV